jgi:hypothetical protein
VDIPSHFSPHFPHSRPASTKTAPSAARTTSLPAFFHPFQYGKISAAVFLNCTKNTELTPARFTRTVTLAFIKNFVRSGRASVRNRNQASRQFTQSGRRHMKSEQWKSYRTRFLVKAKQLSSSLSFVDHLGRQHCGRKGDYLVESSDGVLSIAPRRIFEDIYVLMSTNMSNSTSSNLSNPVSSVNHPALDETLDAAINQQKLGERKPAARVGHAPSFAEKISRLQLDRRPVEALPIERVKLRPISVPHADVAPRLGAARGRRKLPQTCPDRRSSASHASLM